MVKSRLTLFFVAGMLAVASGCSSDATQPPDPFAVRAIPEELSADVDAVVRANTAFALDIYRELKEGEGNLFLSPFSISTALAMTYAGAAGVTAAEMSGVLHFDLATDQLHPAYGELLASLDRGTTLEGYTLDLANRLWAQEGFPFLEEFLEVNRTHYAAPLGLMDFSADPEACRREINGWVENQTRDRIKNLFPPGTINGLTRLVLANAIYFKGLWQTPFDPEETADQAFYVSPGAPVQVPMMKAKKLEANFGGTSELQLLELPYWGEDLSMILLLPVAQDGLRNLESNLTVENLEAWVETLEPHAWDVYLPRFKFTSDFGLNGVLARMGMPSAFDAVSADFSGMDGARDLHIQAVRHKAFVEVNEEGTEAAAATGVSVGITSAPPTFRADHPFLFLIRDNVTGSILFLGRVVDPTASGE